MRLSRSPKRAARKAHMKHANRKSVTRRASNPKLKKPLLFIDEYAVAVVNYPNLLSLVGSFLTSEYVERNATSMVVLGHPMVGITFPQGMVAGRHVIQEHIDCDQAPDGYVDREDLVSAARKAVVLSEDGTFAVLAPSRGVLQVVVQWLGEYLPNTKLGSKSLPVVPAWLFKIPRPEDLAETFAHVLQPKKRKKMKRP